MSEKTEVENKVRKWADANGYYSFKLTPMGKRGLPDHWFIGKFPNLVIMEFKAPGKKVAKGSLQEYVIGILRVLQWPVYIVDNPDHGIRILKEAKQTVDS